MKNRLIISILLLAVIIPACKKSDPGGGMPGPNTYMRLVESLGTNAEGKVIWKDSVFYFGQKVSGLRRYNNDPLDGFIEYYRDELEYPDQQTLVKTEYEINPSTFELDPRYKLTMTYDNDLLTEILYHEFFNDQWHGTSRVVQTYDDGLLQEIKSWWFDMGTWVEMVKIAFSYNGEDLERVVHYLNYGGTWVENSKYEYFYQTGRINQCILSRYDEQSMEWTLYFRYDIDYDADLVSSTRFHEYDTVVSQWEYIGEESYDYNDQGILLSETTFIPGIGNTSITEYTYEPGQGNYEQIYKQDATLMKLWLPFPIDNRKSTIDNSSPPNPSIPPEP